MSVKLNQDAVKFAKGLIKDGKYVSDTDWSEAQPSTEAENRFSKDQGWDTYEKWFLGIDTEYDEGEKERYEFPYGDFKKVHRRGVIAAKQRAAQYEHSDIENAADELLQMIDQRENE